MCYISTYFEGHCWTVIFRIQVHQQASWATLRLIQMDQITGSYMSYLKCTAPYLGHLCRHFPQKSHLLWGSFAENDPWISSPPCNICPIGHIWNAQHPIYVCVHMKHPIHTIIGALSNYRALLRKRATEYRALLHTIIGALCIHTIQGGEDPQDALSCRSFSAKEPYN